MEDSRTTDINVPFPEAGELNLEIRMGACRLRIRPAYGGDWLTGAYQGPSDALPIDLSSQGGRVTIAQQREAWSVSGVAGREVPSLDLALGTARPYALALDTGASANDLELGGLPLTGLAVTHGAGKLVVNFAVPNPQRMASMALTSGAGAMWIRNLGNANFEEMVLKGGAASYQFDFGGTLRHDCRVRIETGVAHVELIVPATTAAVIEAASSLGSIDVGDGLMKRDGAFWTEAALAGTTPVLTIDASVTLGSLKLTVK